MNEFIGKLWKTSPQSIYHLFKKFFENDAMVRELKRISRIPRYKEEKIELFGKEITIADSASFLSMYQEIFVKQIYKFFTKKEKPYIIDCGANIGLSIIYFKLNYPKCRVTAFEPDADICRLASGNLKNFGINDVNLIQKALDNCEGEKHFKRDGADGGHILRGNELSNNPIEITAVRLSDYLHENVDFLKIDIEGKEYDVLEESRQLLNNVENIFIEYHSAAGGEQKLPDILAILKDSGFRIHINTPGLNSAQPFIHRKVENGYDLLINIYAFR